MSADPLDLPAASLSAAIRARNISCREVMAACLARIARLNPAHTAIVALRDPDALMAEAAERDAELDRGLWRGWLHGMPHAVKDTAATRDIPTSFGSPILAGHHPAEDAIAVARIRAAGAILIGKTNVPEFGLGSHSFNEVFGTTRNAWDPSRSAGGSSGGAAVALALGLVPVADGSDFGGSLRNPAGWNNVVGFRPTPGRVPFGPTPELFLQQLGVEGPMARSVQDAALLLATMAGHDPRAPLSLGDPPEAFAQPLDRELRGLRIGWLGESCGLPFEAGVIGACTAAFGAFSALGCVVEPAPMPVPRDALWECWLAWRHFLVGGMLLPLHADPAKRALLKPEAVWEVEGALRLSAMDVHRAGLARSALHRAMLDLFGRFDMLMLPSAQCFPFDAEQRWPREIAGVTMDTYHRWMEVTVLATLAGCPAACVPAGFGAGHGLPIGLQLIGPPRADLAVLQVAHGFEQATGLTRRRPPAHPA